MELFKRNVSSEVAESLWEQREQFTEKGRPRPQKLVATVLFTDLKNFTTTSERLDPAAVVVSPGPGTPRDAGASTAVIRRMAGRRPILGVCLGHQAIGEVFGGTIGRAPEPIHGKTSAIHHDGSGVFAGLASPFEATRYHSLLVERAGLPDCLAVTAWTEDGLIMGLRHRELPVEGVQFHPESILTAAGKRLLANFLRSAGLPVGAGAPTGVGAAG